MTRDEALRGLELARRVQDAGSRAGILAQRSPQEVMFDAIARALEVLLAGQGAQLEAQEDQGWECEDSSTGHCVYNIEADPAEDHCLVCGQPRERK